MSLVNTLRQNYGGSVLYLPARVLVHSPSTLAAGCIAGKKDGGVQSELSPDRIL